MLFSGPQILMTPQRLLFDYLIVSQLAGSLQVSFFQSRYTVRLELSTKFSYVFSF